MARKKKKMKKQRKPSSAGKQTAMPVPSDKNSPDVRNEFQKALALHQNGEFEKAEEIYRTILEIQPNHSDSLHLSGLLCHQKGETDTAMEQIHKAIQIDPTRPNYHNNLGIVFQERGEFDKAIACYQKALEIRPAFSDAHNNIGFALQDQGKLDQAIAAYQKALEISPNYPDAHNNMGTALKDLGKTEEAIACYQKAVQLRPDYAEAHNNMGLALKEQRRFDEAVGCYQKALQIRPSYIEAYSNMGTLFRDVGKFDEALGCYQKALQIKPDSTETCNNMGTTFKEQGKLAESLACYQRAIELKPDNHVAYVNMGNTLQDQARVEDAVTCYQKALQIKPDYVVAYDNMRNAYLYQGRIEEALECCDKSLGIRYDPGIEIRKTLMLPVIYESREQIDHYRKKILQGIAELKNKGIRLQDPHKQVGSTNFYLAYHGLNDRDIQQEIASFYIDACPELETGNWKLETGNSNTGIKHQTSNIKHPTSNIKHPTSNIKHPTSNTRPLKIGFVSMHLYNMNQQTIGRLNRGIIEKLSREKFHVRLFRFPGGESDLIKSIKEGADQIVDLPSDLKPAREIIASHDLDILYYPDIGMDSLTYFLAFSRLARVQCVTWGHPVTTGIPNMDYFISSEHLEPEAAQEHYSEKLMLLKRLPVYYYRPELPDEPPSRKKFGFPEDCHLYICPQAPFKFHPDFDAALAAILRSDPRALLVLIEGQTFGHWAKLLLNRFSKTFPEAIDRVRFLKAIPNKDFLNLLRLADALIEPPYFGGGNTTYESFACGMPIVTWPGPFMRGRVTLGCYRQMGVSDCVASDPQTYVEMALRLANDRPWREEVRGKIRANAHLIFEDMEAIRELEQFFESAVKEYERR